MLKHGASQVISFEIWIGETFDDGTGLGVRPVIKYPRAEAGSLPEAASEAPTMADPFREIPTPIYNFLPFGFGYRPGI